MLLETLWGLPGHMGVTEVSQRLPRARRCKSHPAKEDAQLDKIARDIVFRGFVVTFSRA